MTVLYIAGAGRSGSTLLDRLLGTVPGLVSAGEVVHLWARGVAGNQRCSCGAAFRDCPWWGRVGEAAFGGWDQPAAATARALQHRVDRQRYLPALLAPATVPGFGGRVRAYADVLSRLYRGIGAVGAGDVVVDSSKHASTAYLLRHVPAVDLRVVHLVRDSRGVAHSWTRTVTRPEITDGRVTMPRYRPAGTALRWLGRNLQLHGLAATGVPVLRVRYEDLVTDPDRQLRRILDHADRDPGLAPPVGDGGLRLPPAHLVAGNPMRFDDGPVRIVADEVWRARMAAGPRRGVTALTWPLLHHYGYGGPR